MDSHMKSDKLFQGLPIITSSLFSAYFVFTDINRDKKKRYEISCNQEIKQGYSCIILVAVLYKI